MSTNVKEELVQVTPLEDVKNEYSLTNILQEYRIDVGLAEVPKEPLLPRIDYFDSYVRLLSGVTLPRNIMTIHYDAFKELYDKANTYYTQGDVFFTALRINLGMFNGMIFPLFQAVYYKRETGSTTYNATIYPTKYYYDNTARKFKEYLDPVVSLESEYRRQIGIRHNGGYVFESHIQNTDTDAIIFPFQTVFTLMYDCRQNSDYILVTNSLAVNKRDELLAQHSLLLSGTATTQGLIYDFVNKFANRSHLCPPGCASLKESDLKDS